MRSEHDAMMVVRAELSERLDAVQRFSRRQTRDMAEGIVGIRRLAAAYGLSPVVRLAEAMERGLGDAGSFCPLSLYLDRLHDAIGCGRTDDGASEAMLASVSVRLDG